MKRSIRSIFVVPLLGIGLLTGCASLRTTESGFLSDYSELKVVEEKPNCKIFVSETFDLSLYGQADVAAIDFSIPEAKLKRLNEADVAKFTDEAHTILEEVFGELVEREAVSNAKSLKIRASITDVDTVNVGVNAIASVVAVPIDNGGVSVELEISDSESGRLLLALSGYETGKIQQVGGFFSKLGHARSGLRKIAENVVGILENRNET